MEGLGKTAITLSCKNPFSSPDLVGRTETGDQKDMVGGCDHSTQLYRDSDKVFGST